MLYRPQVSPGRISPIEYNPYNPALIQSQSSPQYQSTNNHIVQRLTEMYAQQQFPYVHDMLQIQPQEQLVLNRMTSNYHEEFQSLDNTGSISIWILYLLLHLCIIILK